MVDLSEIKFASLHVRSRARLMWCRRMRVAGFVYRITPHGREFDHQHKDRRRVEFFGNRAECFSLDDGSQCEANSYGILCSHIYRANELYEKARLRARKKGRKAA